MTTANDMQVGGNHYRASLQHWDFIEDHGFGYLEAAATKYLVRYEGKNGLQDLEKARHYTVKLHELALTGKRMQRGFATFKEIEDFFMANNCNNMQRNCMEQIFRWQRPVDLVFAISHIDHLIANYKQVHGQFSGL